MASGWVGPIELHADLVVCLVAAGRREAREERSEVGAGGHRRVGGLGVAAGHVDDFAREHLAGGLLENHPHVLAGGESGHVGVVDQQHGRKFRGIADEADQRAGLDPRAAIPLVEQLRRTKSAGGRLSACAVRARGRE